MTHIDEPAPRPPHPLKNGGGPEALSPEWEAKFRDDLAADIAVEAGLLVKEAWIVAFIVVGIVLREVLW